MKAFLFCVGAFLLGLSAISCVSEVDKPPCKHCGGDGVVGDIEASFYMCGECLEPKWECVE
mgnify:CR=1 FL=1|jgi:hypothetical protein